MKKHTYIPMGVCSKQIDIKLTDDDRIEEIVFTGGCPGNTAGISRLTPGMRASEVIELLEGTTCGKKVTSCPDQLTMALKEILAKKISA